VEEDKAIYYNRKAKGIRGIVWNRKATWSTQVLGLRKVFNEEK
jgi:hypothetical protein